MIETNNAGLLDLQTAAPELRTACVGVRWQPPVTALCPQHRCMPQVLALATRSDGKRLGARWMVSVNQAVSPAQALTYGCDPYSGWGGDDLCTINVDLPRMPSEAYVVTIWLTLLIADPASPMEFAGVALRLYDQQTGTEYHRCELSCPLDHRRLSAELCRFVRSRDGWLYQPVGEAHPFPSEGIVARYRSGT